MTYFSPPNEAAIATEPTTEPATLAAAPKAPAPITGIIAPIVGAKAPNPAAMAGAANPDEGMIEQTDFSQKNS